MPRIDGTTDRQSSFLRAFHVYKDGPPPEAWPSPAILRRWLRHDGFRRAFADLQRTLRTTLSFQSLLTGLAATQSLHDALRPEPREGPTAPPEIANPNSRIANPTDPAAARAALQRERLRHRIALTFLRLAHARLPRPARVAAKRPHPQPSPHVGPRSRPARDETIEEAALRLMHPNCRPEVAIALLKGEPHPYFDEEMNDSAPEPPSNTEV